MSREGRAVRLLDLRTGESRPVGLAVATSFVASAGLMIGQSAIEALFFARYGVEKLPVMYLVLGGTMFLATLGFSALLGRVGRGRAYIVIPLALAVVAAAGRVGLAGDLSWITPALWLLQGVAQFVVGLAVWGLAGIITDTRQAKRFFPLIAAGGVLGYVLGGLATKPLAAWVGTANLLLVWVATLIVVAVVGTKLVAIGGDVAGPDRRGGSLDAGPIEQLTRGLRYVVRSQLMRWLALGSVLFSLLFFSLYLPFSRAATARYPDPDELAGFFGVFFGLSTGVAFLLSLFVTNRLFARLGVPTVMLVFPLLYVVAFGVLAVQASFTALLVFRFAQVAWMQGGAMSSYEAVINTVPSDRRDQTRAFLYGGPTQVGTVLAGVIALVGERAFSPSMLYGVGFVCAVVVTVAMIGVRRAYPRELVRALREGRPHVFDADPVGAGPFGLRRPDRSAMAAAVTALDDPDPRVRRVSAHVLGDMDPDAATEPLLTCLRDDDADVRATAIASLVRGGSPTALPAIVERASDSDAGVRLATVDAIGALAADDAVSERALGPLLDDAEPAVRARAAAALVRLGASPTGAATLAELAADPDEGVRVAAFQAMQGFEAPQLYEVAYEGLSDAAPAGRAEAAHAVAALDPRRALNPLIEALADDHPLVRDAVAEALGVIGLAAAGSVVASLTSPSRWEGAMMALQHVPLDGRTDDVERFAVEMVTEAVESHGLASAIDDTSDERLTLLKDSLLSRSERRAMLGLRAASVLDGKRAMSVALESLSVTDPAQRANAIELIESVGARAVVTPLLSMWDGTRASIDRDALFERLQRDPDDWIRACAQLVTNAPNVEPEGGTMTRTLATLSPMERVLFLRKVPLFAALAPPDLQPIAVIAEEHAYADGDAIAEQGDPGDAMHIIVNGNVSVVVHRAADEPGAGGPGAAEHVVAVRSSGDVVGEMAVITNEPRIAGLVARGDVRVLSIARPQFESILRERPETALGVIRVLCQRLAEPSEPTAAEEAGTTTTSA